MFIEWQGVIEYSNTHLSPKFISNLKWDDIHVIIQINNLYVGLLVKYYIKNHKDAVFIWEEIKGYLKDQYDIYINNNINNRLYYKCINCSLNNYYEMYIEESKSTKITCMICGNFCDKFIRDYENNYYHINCFNCNPNILKKNKKILLQCKMCNKYLYINDSSVKQRNIPNKFYLFKYIQNTNIKKTYTIKDDIDRYTLLFVIK